MTHCDGNGSVEWLEQIKRYLLEASLAWTIYMRAQKWGGTERRFHGPAVGKEMPNWDSPQTCWTIHNEMGLVMLLFQQQ